MPKLIIEIEEALKDVGEDRVVSGFLFKVRIDPMPGETGPIETFLPSLVPMLFEALKKILNQSFGKPTISLMAVIPPEGEAPLPEIGKMVADYCAGRDAEFPSELENMTFPD